MQIVIENNYFYSVFQATDIGGLYERLVFKGNNTINGREVASGVYDIPKDTDQLIIDGKTICFMTDDCKVITSVDLQLP
ncbi:hypothetical protein KC723_02185 [Candidatus Kaiserbacteria bacterium]|nr:hypothetical protein [Candidatus Kaiserbacteria bacterium]